MAHPKGTMFPVIEAFEQLPQGIEVWNSKYDGRYAPRPGNVPAARKAQGSPPRQALLRPGLSLEAAVSGTADDPRRQHAWSTARARCSGRG